MSVILFSISFVCVYKGNQTLFWLRNFYNSKQNSEFMELTKLIEF